MQDLIPNSVFKGKVYTLDHRRLVAYRVAKRDIPYVMATAEEIDDELEEKLSTKDDGMSIELRKGKRK
ncbi:MAG: hypothetical protein GKS00_01125 [Alphaproteobacteria bacterium]|nr:hypothetical protein [Alphaproteobacteria bacterium]